MLERKKEEIENEEEKKKKLLKSNYIRKNDKIKNKKFKFKRIKIDKKNLFGPYDNSNEYENNIYVSQEYIPKEDNNKNKGSEVTKIKKMTEQKKVNGEFNDLYTTKKQYKLTKNLLN